MATASKRDVRLGVGIETTGEDDLKRLAAGVRQLGAEGGPAAAQFDALADQIDRLANQAGRVDTLRRLTAEVDQLSAKQTEAAAAAAKANEALQQQASVVTEVRSEQQRLGDAVLAARSALREAGDSVRALRDGTDTAGRKTAEFADAMERARANVRAKAEALDQARADLSRYGATVSTAINEEARLGAAAQRTTDALVAAARATGQREGALRATQAALVAAGGATTDLAQAEQDLLDQQQRLVAEAQAQAAAHQQSVEAMQALEAAARRADAEYAQLAASLKSTQAAAAQYATATDRVVAASERDEASLRSRVAAAQALLASDEQLTVAQRELAATLDTGRNALLSEAQALLAQQRAADAAAAATQRLVSESISAGRAIETAFGATGVRSLSAIEDEARATERAVSLLQRQFAQGAISAQDLARAVGAAEVKLERLRVEASQIQSLPGTFERLNGTLTGLINRFGALTAAVGTVGIAVRPAVEAFIALDQATRVLTTITGSSESATKQIEFLRQSAQRNGQSFDTLAGSYAKFAASALQTGLSLETVQSTFDAVSNAAGNMGLSTDQTQRALEALGQIASKGVVNMEELRQQLGDALPGVLPLLAKELGITTAELNKLVESGGFASRDALPAIRNAIRTLGTQGGAEVKGLVQEWSRFTSALSEGATLLGQGAVGQALGGLLFVLGKVAGVAVVAGAGLAEMFTVAGRGAGAFFGTLAGGGGLNAALGAFGTESDKANARLVSLAERFGLTGSSASGAAGAVAGAGAAAGAASPSFAKLALTQAEAQAAADLAARSSEKHAQALNTAVTEAEHLSKTIVNQKEAFAVVIAAQDQYVVGLERQEAADRRVLDTLQQSKQQLLDKIAAEKLQTDAYKAQITALDEKIAKAEADLQKTAATVQSENAKAQALRASALAVADNSKEYDTLRAAVDKAEAALKEVNARAAKGTAALGETERATKALREAKLKLKDASEDLSKAFESEIKIMQSQQALAEAGIKLEIERLRQRRAQAEYEGQLRLARELDVQIAEQEVRIARTKVDLSRSTTEVKLREIQATRDAAEASGILTPQLRAELQAKENLAQAEAVNAKAEAVSAESKRIETQRLRDVTERQNTFGDAISRTTDLVNKNTDALNANNKSLDVGNQIAGIRVRQVGENGREPNVGDSSTDSSRTGARSGVPSTGATSLTSIGSNGLPSNFSISGQIKPPDNSGKWVFNVDAWMKAGGINGGFSEQQLQRFWMLNPEAAAAQVKADEEARAALINGRTDIPKSGVNVFQPAIPQNVISAPDAEDQARMELVQAVSQETAADVRRSTSTPQELTRVLVSLENYLSKMVDDPPTSVAVTVGGKVTTISTNRAGVSRLISVIEEAQRLYGDTGP